ncbi:NADH-quinone oxidoreductase subunit N [Acidimicrobiia bacterium EGI L10123]|uniref:NADH-quinone oxidoreductase subunit N n=1 Tax=Salinilacustrithrix flava TaxID=2957203 RepID=UPI003D7C1AC1|nr:NADH-quinone oxidoreductase subunit N [Acidimicrobiia bacterium EGI L10123]
MLAVLAQVSDFVAPNIDFHAFGPELALVGALVAVLVVDVIKPDGNNPFLSSIAGLGVLGALIPVITLATDGADRFLFDGAYVVDNFSLVLKALFLVSGYVVILMSTNYIAEGDYAEGEYYILLLSSLIGMTLMASARDLITVFIALELLSIPAYMLAGWRKRDLIGNEAGVKYYLMGVFASAVLLYGMSLLFGVAGDTRLTEIGQAIAGGAGETALITLAIVFVVVGFAFKVSAVPFHTWAPDVYEGAPTPITAFLAVASKAAGFVALLQVIYLAFPGRDDVIQPLMWVLAAATMTIGNLIALRQTNVVRLLAYSGVAQAGFILAPLSVASELSLQAVITYLVIYAAMNLGAFAAVIGIARKTRSAEITSFGGLFEYAPGLTVILSLFLFSLAGIPPLGGWLAKFVVFRALADANTASGYVMGAIVAVNSVIALYYYANVAREMWMKPVPDGDRSPVVVPFSIGAALALTVVATMAFGVSNLATRLGDQATFLAF